MSLITNTNEYFVTIDSEFRDNEKYPIETDFAVKFQTGTSDNPFVKGVPVSNDFFIPLQIDPNVVDNYFRVKGGTILNIQKITEISFILCGLMTPNDIDNVFAIETYPIPAEAGGDLAGTPSFTILSKEFEAPYFTSVYLCKLTYTNNTYVSNWFIYLDKYDTIPFTTNDVNYCNFTIDVNNNIYFTFDFSAPYFSLKRISTTSINPIIYNIQNPSSVNNTCLALFAFDINGSNFYVDGHDWGYHIIESSNDILSTEINGRIGINIDTANNVYLGSNTNPYEPTYFETLNANGVTEFNNYMFMFKDTNNIDNILCFIQKPTAQSYAIAKTYSIQTNGTTQLTSNQKNFGGVLNSDYYNFHSDGTYFFQNSTTCYIIANYYSTSQIYINVSSINLSTGVLTLTGVVTPYQQLTNNASYVISSVKYGTTIYTAFIFTNNNAGPNRVRIVKLDLTNLAAGFTVVATSSNITITNFDNNMSLTTFIQNDIVYITVSNSLGEINILKGQVTATTFTFLSQTYSNTLITNGLLNIGSFMFYKSSKYYLVLGTTIKSTTSIFDITDLTNISKLSTVNDLTCSRISLYLKDSNYFLVDNLGDIYNINDPTQPLLLTTKYPKIEETESIKIWNISTDFEQEFGILTKNDLLTNKEFLTNYPFIYKDVIINSIHYNQNLENQIINENYITFDIINSNSSSTTTQNFFSPSNLINNGLIAWYDGSDQTSFNLSGDIINQWKDKSGNNYHLDSSGINRPTYDRTNQQVNFTIDTGDGGYLSGSYGDTISPKYVIIASRNWNDVLELNATQNTLNPLLEIGDINNSLGFYKTSNLPINSSYRSYNLNVNRINVTSIPATSESYTYSSTTNNALVNTGGKHPFLYQNNSIKYYNTTSNTKYIVGLGSGSNTLSYSIDGTEFISNGSSIFTTQGNNSFWSSDLCVAVGQGTNTIAYSSNGKDWTGIGTSIFSVSGNVIINNTIRWVAGGNGATHTLAYSNDGINWTGNNKTIFTTICKYISWSNSLSLFVAVGQGTNTIAYSSDGISWTGIGTSIFSTSGNTVVWSDYHNLFLAGGQGTNSLAYSSDGINWTGLGYIGPIIFPLTEPICNSIDVDQFGFFIAGFYSDIYNFSIYGSYDGITWGGNNTPFQESCNSVKYTGQYWIFGAGGVNTTNTLAYSNDGINIIGLGNNIFKNNCYGFGYPQTITYSQYTSGILENFYQDQVSFDGIYSINNENGTNNPLTSSGWNSVPAQFKLGLTDILNNGLSRELVFGAGLPVSGSQIIVQNNISNISYLTAGINEIIVLDYVPSDSQRKQIQAYLNQKYNLWVNYIGENPYEPIPSGSTIVAVDGLNLKYNFLNYSDITNIQPFCSPINIINSLNDPYNIYNVPLIHSNIINFSHAIDNNNNIYFFLCFLSGDSIYLSCLKTDNKFNLLNSNYIQLETGILTPTNILPISNIIAYTKISKTQVYCAVQYIDYPHTVKIYNYNDGFSLFSNYALSYNNNTWIQTGGSVIEYTDSTGSSSSYLYSILNQPSSWDGTFGYNGSLLQSSVNFGVPSVVPIYENIKCSSNKYGIQSFDINENKYLYVRALAGSDKTFVFDLTNINGPYSYKEFTGWKYSPIYNPNSYNSTNWNTIDNEVPSSIFYNPLDQNIYNLFNYNPTDVNSLNTPPSSPINIQQYFTYKNITDLNNIPGAGIIPITSTNLGYRIGLIKYGISGQKVFASLLITDSTSENIKYIQCYDVTNLVYATQYYKTSSFSTPSITSYDNLNGIGLAFINKINISGQSEWLNYLGGDTETLNSVNVNLSNMDIDPSLSYLYVCGGWKYKIESFDKDNNKLNKITSYDTNYNGYLAKIILKDGTFEWLLPSIGFNNDYFERLSYIDSKNLICLVNHFESPILLVYEPQISSSGPFTNPEVVNLNLSNISTQTSSLIAFNTNGSVQFHTKIYSNLSLQYIQLYDISIDENSNKKRIYVSGISNATQINSIDSSGLQTQLLYNDIDPLTQKAIIIYQYDLDGLYEASQNVIFPSNYLVNLSDIRTFSLFNRMIVFTNIFKYEYKNQYIYVYNQDGSYGKRISFNNQTTPLEVNLSFIFEYLYDSTYVDENNISYSKIVIPYFEFNRPFQSYPNPDSQDLQIYGQFTPLFTNNNSLINYNLFIMGNLFDNTALTFTNQTLIASTDTLNKNFSIRYNFINPDNNNYNIVINQEILLKNLVRNNIPVSIQGKTFWCGSVVKSILNSIIAYDTTLIPNASNQLTITNIYGNLLDTSKKYYIMFPVYTLGPGFVTTNLETSYIEVLSVNYNSTSKVYTLTLSSTNPLINSDFPSGFYGPYIYLSNENLNANYTIQFCPTPLRSITNFKTKLNSLIIPNRRIKNSYLPGTRDLNDFRYLILEVYNENNSEQFPEIINSNDFFNNPNYIDYINRCKGTFVIPISGINVSSTSNFIILDSIDIPVVTFFPGFYNIRIILKDIYGNVVQFDSTPNSDKQSDNIFINNFVESPLMQITAKLTFTKI